MLVLYVHIINMKYLSILV